jgi:hypothetical protein
MAASVSAEGRMNAPNNDAPMRLQSESGNHIYKPEGKLRLFHGDDIASVFEDGNIRIKTYRGQWVNYGGHDDEGFRFGDLRGRAAKDEALACYASASKADRVFLLPTDGSASQPDGSQPAPSQLNQ